MNKTYIQYKLLFINGSGHQPYHQISAHNMDFEGGLCSYKHNYIGILKGPKEDFENIIGALKAWDAKLLTTEEAITFYKQANPQGNYGADTEGKVVLIPDPNELDVIYVPTEQSIVEKMLELANIQPNDILYDLGCGDGRFLVTAATKYNINCIGVDLDPIRMKESQTNIDRNSVRHLITLYKENFFKIDLSQADVLILVLSRELNEKLLPQLLKMKSGSRIISLDSLPLPYKTHDLINVAVIT